MVIQYGVKLIGAVYVVLGILGFITVNPVCYYHPEGVGAYYILNLVAVNWLHNVIHLAIGISGWWATRSVASSQLWGKIAGAGLLLLFAAGMGQAFTLGFPIDQMLLQLVPLNSPGHVLHLVSGGLALYLGFRQEPEFLQTQTQQG